MGVGVVLSYVAIMLGVIWCCCDVRGTALLVRFTGVVWERPALWLGVWGVAAVALYLSAQERLVRMEFAPPTVPGDAGTAQMA